MGECGIFKVEYERADETEEEGREWEEDGDGGEKRHGDGNIFSMHLKLLGISFNTQTLVHSINM